MSTVDASIPLAGLNANAQAWDPQRMISMQDMAQQMRMRQQAQQLAAQQQNALRTIFADPANMGPTGELRPEAVQKVMQIDPKTGMQLREQMQTNRVQDSEVEKNHTLMHSADLEQRIKKFGYIDENVLGPALVAYREAVKNGISPEQAAQVAQTEYMKGIKSAKASGIFSEDEQDKFPPAFDYQRVSSNSQTFKTYVAEQEKKKSDDLAAKKEAERERHDEATEKAAAARESRVANAIDNQTKGWEIKEGVDKDGKPQWMRINKGTGEVRPVTGAAPAKKLSQASESERKAAMNYTTMKNAEDEIEKQGKAGNDKLAFLSTIQRDEHGYLTAVDRFGRNQALSPEQQVVAQAALQFAEGAGHLKSGARINNETMGIITNLYIPMPGDSKDVIARKQEARRNDIKAARIGGGRAVEALEEAERGGADPKSAGDFSHLWSN